MIKKLSLKGFADFISSSPTTQRRILKDYKYPSEDEARAKILYYREARDRISAYHASNHPIDWLFSEARSFYALSSFSINSRRRARLKHNSRGILQYAKHFAQREFEVLDDVSFDLSFNDVIITVFPDLHVSENNKEKIIKFEFSKKEPDTKTIRIISQCLFEASNRNGLNLSSSCVLYLDIPRGHEYRGARMGSRVLSDIEATCMNISAIWDTI